MSNTSPTTLRPRLDGNTLRFLGKVGIGLIAIGILTSFFGIYPGTIGLDTTKGIGLAQLVFILLGIYIATGGGYLWAFAVRLRGLERRLREDIGLRLGVTGLVICTVSALIDILGLGTHSPPETFPFFGKWQAFGLWSGLAIIFAGILLYAQRVSPRTGFTQPISTKGK